MSKKIYILDNIFDGHHKVYMDTLEKIENVINISTQYKFELDKLNIYKYMKSRMQVLEYGLNQISNQDILHLLYIDPLYIISPIFRNKGKKVIGTLHHFPQNKAKELLLKLFSKKIHMIIVHSEYLKLKLSNIGITNVTVIDYPVFSKYNIEKIDDIKKIRNKYGIDEDKYIISALGGTRKDKGLDILLESFKYLKKEIKSKIKINICGKEEDIKEEYIINKCRENNIDYNLKLDYLTDDEFWENIYISDCIVIPYRKIFTGNSGPMTEGVYMKKPIIAPNNDNLGYLMNKYDLGVTFESENAKSLSNAIEVLVNNGWEANKKSNIYIERLNVSRFIEGHNNLYKNLIME